MLWEEATIFLDFFSQKKKKEVAFNEEPLEKWWNIWKQ